MTTAETVLNLWPQLPDPEAADWHLIVVGLGGARRKDRPSIYRFPDGSMVTMDRNHLPMVYVGG